VALLLSQRRVRWVGLRVGGDRGVGGAFPAGGVLAAPLSFHRAATRDGGELGAATTLVCEREGESVGDVRRDIDAGCMLAQRPALRRSPSPEARARQSAVPTRSSLGRGGAGWHVCAGQGNSELCTETMARTLLILRRRVRLPAAGAQCRGSQCRRSHEHSLHGPSRRAHARRRQKDIIAVLIHFLSSSATRESPPPPPPRVHSPKLYHLASVSCSPYIEGM
jgi:hypothetical protein